MLLNDSDYENSVAKVGDFGCAKIMNTLRSVATGRTGTLAFNSPETFIGKYSEASDVYSFAMLCFEVVTRQAPWRGLSEAEVFEHARSAFDKDDPVVKRLQGFGVSIEQQKQEWIQNHPLSERRPDLSSAEQDCPEALLHLIERCWADDTANRPTFAECCDTLEAIGSHQVPMLAVH